MGEIQTEVLGQNVRGQQRTRQGVSPVCQM